MFFARLDAICILGDQTSINRTCFQSLQPVEGASTNTVRLSTCAIAARLAVGISCGQSHLYQLRAQQ